MKPFQFTLAAERDLVEIDAYLAERSDSAADAVLGDIEATCRLLSEHPGAGRRREELGPEVMSFPTGSHVVFYTVQEGMVVVLRVLHGHRDIPNVF